MMRIFLLGVLALSALPWARSAPRPPPAAVDGADLQEGIDALAQASGLTAGIAIKDLTTDEEFLHNPDKVFPQGSSIRIHLVAELFRQAAAKKLSLDEIRTLPESARTAGTGVLRFLSPDSFSMSLRDYAILMIAVNDHSAANFLTDVVGMENVNASLVAQGTPQIKYRRRVVNRGDAAVAPENVGTPRAVMRSLELLHRGEVVDRTTSEAILDVLSVPEVGYFRREVPRGVIVAGRSGSGPSMRCEVRLVRLPDRPFVLCVMVKGLPFVGVSDYSKADALIGGVTRLALRHFMPNPAAPPPAADAP